MTLGGDEPTGVFVFLYLLFEKKQKVMFIFLAQEKGTKRTST